MIELFTVNVTIAAVMVLMFLIESGDNVVRPMIFGAFIVAVVNFIGLSMLIWPSAFH